MKLPAAMERIRLSKQAKSSLVKLKRYTGISHWYVLCRWAYFHSLADERVLPSSVIVADSSIDMSWRTFAGEFEQLYLLVLKERCLHDNLELSEQVLAEQFQLHLHRGIAQLSTKGKITGVDDFVSLALG